MVRKTTLYLGLNDKITKKQELSTTQAYKATQDIVLRSGVSGCTFYSAKGMYMDSSGEVVTEETLKIEFINVAKSSVKYIVNSLKLALNQESVLMHTEAVKSMVV